MDYLIHLLVLICMYLMLAQSFNITFGLGRLLNLSHISVFAIGAYVTALLSTGQSFIEPMLVEHPEIASLSRGFFFCIAASIVIGALFSLLLGAIAIKLSEEYFALGTLAFSYIVSAVLINWKSVTRGVLGIPGIPRPIVLDRELTDNWQFLVLIAGFTLVSLIVMRILFYTRLSRQLRAQSESNSYSQSLSINTRATRNDAFIIASAFAALSGSFFAYYINYIDPTSFSLSEMIFVLSIVVVGGPGSFYGTILSTIFLVLLPEPLRFIGFSPSVLGPMRQLLYALILFTVIYLKRKSLFPVQRSV